MESQFPDRQDAVVGVVAHVPPPPPRAEEMLSTPGCLTCNDLGMAHHNTRKPGDSLRRRPVLTGVAWAVPVVTVASSAPALAASGPTALAGNGSIVRNSCAATTSAPGAVTVTFDSRPAYTTTTQPTNGFWVTNVPSGVTIVSATRTIYVDSRFTNVS